MYLFAKKCPGQVMRVYIIMYEIPTFLLYSQHDVRKTRYNSKQYKNVALLLRCFITLFSVYSS